VERAGNDIGRLDRDGAGNGGMNLGISSASDMPAVMGDMQTPYDLLRLLRCKTQEYGFAYFTVLKLPAVGEAKIGALSELSNWPAELTRTYDERKVGSSSPILKRLSQSAMCFQYTLDELPVMETGKRPSVIDLFRKFDMVRWAYFPVHCPSYGTGAIGYSGQRDELDIQEMGELQLVSTGIFDQLAKLRGTRDEEKPRLTERERECLRWTAEGKTSFEIGKIIGISEHTVNYYLNTASGKLKSTNRVQAVAVALRSGLLG
jgi:LuxR family transcriptional regulator, quorum-sensing system regulator BjaR1